MLESSESERFPSKEQKEGSRKGKGKGKTNQGLSRLNQVPKPAAAGKIHHKQEWTSLQSA